MAPPLHLVVNGVVVDVDLARFDPNTTTLSQWLRLIGKTGTKEGCAEGDCGACSVAVADKGGWRSMTSCIAPLALLLGKEVVTAEGLANDDGLHPVQAAMIKHYGSQCGYCTPGFVTSMFEAFERTDLRGDDSAAVADQLSGNLCRCTGYRPIRDALAQALSCRDRGVVDADLVQLGSCKSSSSRAPTPMPGSEEAIDLHTAGSRFVRPVSLAALLAIKGEQKGNALLIGGATELGVLLRKRFARFPLLVDTAGVASLSIIERGDASSSIPAGIEGLASRSFEDCWIVGGAATLAELEGRLRADPVMLPAVRMLRVFASRQIKNRATLAGNIVTASPIGDMPPVLLALGAALELSSARGVRTVPIAGFFTGYRKTLLADDEVLTRIFVPRPAPGARFRTFKVSKRRELDIAIVSAAFHLERDPRGTVTRATLAFGGVAATPALATKAAALLVGRTVVDASRDVRAALAETFTPLSDVRAGKEFRAGLVLSLWDRFVDDTHGEAHDGDLAFAVEGAWPAIERADAATRALHHDSARGHVTGSARYVDDVAASRGALEVWPVRATIAHGTLQSLDVSQAQAMPGVRLVLTAADIPGHNDVGAIRKDEPLLVAVGGKIEHHAQPLAVIVADTVEQAQAAAAVVVVVATPLPPIIGIRAAMDAGSFHARLDGQPAAHTLRKGDAASALKSAKHKLSFSVDIGGQEHFYLETQAAFAVPGDDGDVQVWSSTQHPSEVQAVVAHVLHVARNQVVVTSPRMGGGFGGKETQGSAPAAFVALAATRLQRPVRLQYDRDIDMEVTGKRHPFLGKVDVGFDDDGRITALVAELFSDGGFALDLSESIHDRALFHIDNCYDLEHILVSGRVCKTNVVSHTAFRGFGGPQGMLLMEDALTRIAQALGKNADDVRERNFYATQAPFGVTPYHQPVDDFRVARMWPALLQSAEVSARRTTIAAFNANSKDVKRGLSVTPVKFGISFTASFLNQAGALVVIYRDGSVQVNHAGTEMGQGLYTKVQGIAARELGLATHSVRVMQTTTDKVPNTSATAASSGADLNGAAVVAAMVELKARLRPVAAFLLERALGTPVTADDVVFAGGHVQARGHEQAGRGIAFSALCEAAYVKQVQLSATGFYKTPDIGYDKNSGRGKPFHYFAYGVCAAEVEIDATTGMKRVLRVDVLHDVGDSLNPGVDRGQVEGALVQGIGWLTGEELAWSPEGKLLSHSASTYQIPSFSDAPGVFKVALLDDDTAPEPSVVHGSKAVGEPPLMLALAVREALKEALGAFGDPAKHVVVDVGSPLSHEVLFHAVRKVRAS
ncbi:MAG: xanthine dehydrogenase molybdopterin binding subunit [Deltaproteobacteria bacterium]|nr:xanthine dehydrogenase molybdopterin binding subunit [Deltaproteobacteria bacterium]